MAEQLHYDEINSLIVNNQVFSSASELHGILCSYICSGKSHALQQFYNLYETALSKEAKGRIAELYQTAITQISGMTFDFQLLLPDDDDDLSIRAKSLGHWCRGFYEHLIAQGTDYSALDSQELKDALLHISEIAKIDYENVDISDQDEHSFQEIVEYVRMSVLMIYTEIMQHLRNDPRIIQQSGTVH